MSVAPRAETPDVDTASPQPGEQPGRERTLERLVAINLGWGLANRTGARLVVMVTGIVLARILTPTDYGTYAVAIILMELLLGVNDLGLIAAITRYQRDVARAAPTATSLAAVSSLILYAMCFAAAPWIAAALNVPDATSVLRVAALVVLVDAACAVPAALLTRAFRQDRRTVADVAGLVVYAAVSIGLAKHGAGVWSLVLGRILGGVVTAGVVVAVAPLRPRPGFDRRQARELLSIGLPLAGAGLLSLALLNLDYIVIGRLLGPAQLGLYLVAFNLSLWPFQLVFTAVQRVSVVGFSRLTGDRQAQTDALNRSMTLLTAVIAPACLAIGLLAGPLVRVVYGDRWSPAADALRFLVVFGAVRAVEALVENFLTGIGRAVATLSISALWLVTLLPAILRGARIGGIAGVGVAHAAVAVVVVLPAALITTRRGGIDLRPWLRNLMSLGASALAGAAAAWLLIQLLDGDVPRLLGAGTACVAVYTAVALSRPDLRALVPARRGAARVRDIHGGVRAAGESVVHAASAPPAALPASAGSPR